ncbi:MAG: family 16 glycoside hydrolase [Candidatus Promineifilaceae bacterium]|jgi:hypothetical protein
MRVQKAIIAMIIAIFFLSACDSLPEVDIPFTDSGPDACNAGGTLFADDFSGEQNCGWAEYNRGGAVVAIEDGSLNISTSSPGEIWWTNPGRTFDDVIINIEASQTGGVDDNAYGVLCRYQNEQNFYLFLISGDGYYAIGKYSGTDVPITYLTPDGQYQASDVINQGIASNDIQASCIGNQLSLAVNGEPLLTVTDNDFSSGDIGLAASAMQQGTVEISFDDLRIFAP